MLRVNVTENMTGVTISGDYNDLNNLHSAISNVISYEDKFGGYECVQLTLSALNYDLRHAYMGNRMIEQIDNGMTADLRAYHKVICYDTNIYYSVNITWPEIIFDVFALKDYINMALDHKYAKKLCDDLPKEYRKEYIEHLPVDCATINQFRYLVLDELRKTLGDRRYASIRNLMKNKNSNNTIINRNFYGFCTQYLEELTVKYIDTDIKKRKALLASIARKLLDRDEEYYEVEYAVHDFARKNNVSLTDVRMHDLDWPEEIVW